MTEGGLNQTVIAKSVTSVQQIEITEERAGQRLDNFLKTQLKGVPFSLVQRIIRKGEVRVNKGRIKPGYRLNIGDTVRIPPVRTADRITIEPGRNLLRTLEQAILYEDDRLLVLNKPSGLAVHGGSGIRQGVIEAVRAMRPDCKGLELVHRIDRDTSGCLLIAKKRSMLRYLHEQLRSNLISKHYQLIVEGKWSATNKLVERPLQKNTLKSGERIVIVHPDGKYSCTVFQVLKRFSQFTLLEAVLKTGRTHQIRVHSQVSGNCILGDAKYSSPESLALSKKLNVRQLCLHAYELSFLSPEGVQLSFSSPLPDTFNRLLDDSAS